MRKTRFIFFFLFVIAMAFAVSAHGGIDNPNEEHHSMMAAFYSGMLGMSFFGWTIMVLILIALILFIVWLIKQLERKRR